MNIDQFNQELGYRKIESKSFMPILYYPKDENSYCVIKYDGSEAETRNYKIVTPFLYNFIGKLSDTWNTVEENKRSFEDIIITEDIGIYLENNGTVVIPVNNLGDNDKLKTRAFNNLADLRVLENKKILFGNIIRINSRESGILPVTGYKIRYTEV